MRQQPDADKYAVASGIAFGVVALLFLGWAVIFFRSIQGSLPAAVSPASEEIFDAINRVSNAPVVPPQLPDTYLPIAEPSHADASSGPSPTSAQQKSYEDLMREDEAAMRALRGDIVLPKPGATTSPTGL